MQTPAFLNIILMAVTMAFNPTEEAQVPYVRFYNPMNGVYMVKVNNAPDYIIEPIVANELISAKDVYAQDKNMKALINAGFFDPNNGKTISNRRKLPEG